MFTKRNVPGRLSQSSSSNFFAMCTPLHVQLLRYRQNLWMNERNPAWELLCTFPPNRSQIMIPTIASIGESLSHYCFTYCRSHLISKYYSNTTSWITQPFTFTIVIELPVRMVFCGGLWCIQAVVHSCTRPIGIPDPSGLMTTKVRPCVWITQHLSCTASTCSYTLPLSGFVILYTVSASTHTY